MKKPTNNHIAGVLLIIVGLIALFISVPHFKFFEQINADQPIDADYYNIDSANEGKLITVSGDMQSSGEISDTTFGVSRKTVMLKRVVEIYQWHKECTDYCTYEKGWYEGLIDSSEFEAQYHNPTSAPYESQEFINDQTAFGAYQIPAALLHKLDYDTTLGPDELGELYDGSLTVFNEYLTNSKNLASPQIGDYRISYRYVKDKKITVTAQQSDGSLVEYRKSNKDVVFEIKEGATEEGQTEDTASQMTNAFYIFLLISGALLVVVGLYKLLSGVKKGKK